MQFPLNQTANQESAICALKNIKPTWLAIRVILGSVMIGKTKSEVELGQGIPIAATDNFPQFQGWWAGDLWILALEIPSEVNVVECSDQTVTS